MKLKDIIFSVQKEYLYKNVTILGIKFKIRRHIFEQFLCFWWNKFAKVKKNKILFVNITSFQYACNLKYIANELLKRNNNFDLVWVTNKNTDTSLIPKEFRLVPYTSIRFLWEFITAGAFICNSHMLLPLRKGAKKNNETIYFQTFHGSMGIKKIEGDVEAVYSNLGWLSWQKESAATFDYLFTDSQFETNIFTSAFWHNGEIQKLGKARDSIFYIENAHIIKKVKEFYNIPQNNKILLYAPTWRPDKKLNCYGLDIKLLKRALQNRFGGDWCILIRGHYHMRKTFPQLYDMTTLIDATDYIDMQELLVAADVLISDYSSCIPEYTILKKPSFIYATDIQDYQDNGNSFYYPLSTLPSPIATDNGELAENILNFDNDKFVARCNEFLQEMGHEDDENSCKRIVDFILEKMNER